MKHTNRYIVLIVVLIMLAGCATINIKESKQFAALHHVPILITELITGYPNSAGGVNLYVNFINLTQKSIKYADITVVAINRVGDPVYGQIRHSRTRTVQCMGPVNPGSKWYSNFKPTWFENIWYSKDINSLRLDSVKITYMDGKTERIIESEKLNAMIAK